MNVKNNIFSSKPKQISQAALQILLKVFGELNKVVHLYGYDSYEELGKPYLLELDLINDGKGGGK